jgi:hypothetical protein
MENLSLEEEKQARTKKKEGHTKKTHKDEESKLHKHHTAGHEKEKVVQDELLTKPGKEKIIEEKHQHVVTEQRPVREEHKQVVEQKKS